MRPNHLDTPCAAQTALQPYSTLLPATLGPYLSGGASWGLGANPSVTVDPNKETTHVAGLCTLTAPRS